MAHQVETKNIEGSSEPVLSGRRNPATVRWQTSSPREEWWSSFQLHRTPASDLAGLPFGPQVGGVFFRSETALDILRLGGLRYLVGMFISLAKPNKVFQPDASFAGAAEQQR